MFEEYLQDSHHFLEIANRISKGTNKGEARRYYRVSVICAASAIEAFVNYIGDSFAKANNIKQYEIAFLNDKRLVFSPDKGLVERVEFHKIDDKLRLLLNMFVPNFDFGKEEWFRFVGFKDFRDSLVHPRQAEDETTVDEYEKQMSAGLGAIIEIMNQISKGMFQQPLRQQLLDLIPE